MALSPFEGVVDIFFIHSGLSSWNSTKEQYKAS